MIYCRRYGLNFNSSRNSYSDADNVSFVMTIASVTAGIERVPCAFTSSIHHLPFRIRLRSSLREVSLMGMVLVWHDQLVKCTRMIFTIHHNRPSIPE